MRKKVSKKKVSKKKEKKKISKKKTNKRIGGKKSKAIVRTKEKKQSAVIGNSFWKARSTHGRNPIFKNHLELWDACVQYFEWVEDNPLQEEKIFSFQGKVHSGNINKIRAMTIGGLCIFLDICQNTWTNYREKKAFLRVTNKAEEIIKSQKFEGAAADLLNANIIARDLGLKEKTELTGANGKPVSVGFYLPSNGREQDLEKDDK